MWFQKTKLFLVPALAFCAFAVSKAQSPIPVFELPDDRVLERAENGDGEAQFEWALRLSDKTGDDNPEVLAWYKKSADNGYAEGYNALALAEIYNADEPDLIKAQKLWSRSIELGSWTAKLNYGTNLFSHETYGKRAYRYLMELETEPELEEHEELQKVRHAALFEIYTFKFAGQDTQPGIAIAHGKKCAYGNHSQIYCQFLLARYLDNGWAGETDTKEADKLFLAAAEQGHAASQWYTGMNYLNGDFEKDEAEAYRWVRQSAEQGYMDGMISFAVMNATGEGTDLDLDNAFQWYEKAAGQGSHHALRGLSYMHLKGEGRPVNERLAIAGLIIASKDDEIARNFLATSLEDYDGNEAEIAKELATELEQIKEKYGFE